MTHKKRLEDYCEREQKASPPPRLIQSLEASVMDAIKPKSHSMVWAMGLVGVMSVLLGIFLFPKQIEPKPFQVESVIMMEKHTAIWIEPISKLTKG